MDRLATTLARIVVDTLAFLKMSDDDVIDPDAANELADHISRLLVSMPAEQQAEFRTVVGAMAADAADRGEEQDLIDFLRKLATLFTPEAEKV